jgi:hypothetical protein
LKAGQCVPMLDREGIGSPEASGPYSPQNHRLSRWFFCFRTFLFSKY